MRHDISEHIRKYGKDLGRLCSSLCSCVHDAEDLYQATWEKVLKNYKKCDPEKSFDKWLWSICISTYKDMMKKPFRKRLLTFSTSEDLERVLHSIPSQEENKDDYIALHTAVNKLSPQKREVIALYYFKDYTTAQVAEILGIPEGTVKSRLSSARTEIRKELNHE